MTRLLKPQACVFLFHVFVEVPRHHGTTAVGRSDAATRDTYSYSVYPEVSHAAWVLMQPQGQIFRDVVPAVDLVEARTQRPWDWVCAALVHKDKGEVRIPMAL